MKRLYRVVNESKAPGHPATQWVLAESPLEALRVVAVRTMNWSVPSDHCQTVTIERMADSLMNVTEA